MMASASSSPPYCFGQPIEVVAHHHLPVSVEPGLGQGLTDRRQVGVDDLTKQQLRADGYDFDVHRLIEESAGGEREANFCSRASPGVAVRVGSQVSLDRLVRAGSVVGMTG